MYRVNNNGGLIQDKNGTQTLVVTEKMLDELSLMCPFMPDSPIETVNVWRAINVLVKYFPEAFLPDLTFEDAEASKWAQIHVVNASALLSDRLFINRIWFMTAETVLNQPLNYFKLRFPYIEGNE